MGTMTVRKAYQMAVSLTGASSSFSSFVATDNPAGVNTSSTTATFSSVNIGTAASNRVVVVCVQSIGAVITAVDIGGVTATKAIEESADVSGLQIWYATVPSGSTATITLTSGIAANDQTIQVGTFNSGASAVPSNTNSTVAGSTPRTLALTIPTGGFGLYVMGCEAGGPPSSPLWAGTGMTTDFSTPNVELLSSAHTVSSGSITGTFTWTGGSRAHAVGAAWGP